MTLVDTSAWVHFLRATDTPAHHAVRDLIHEDADIATTDVIVMEVLAGARDVNHHGRLRRMVARCELVPVIGVADYEDAAVLYQRCRRGGATIRALTDCLIAAVALRADLPILHADPDFDVLSEHVGVRVVSLPGAS